MCGFRGGGGGDWDKDDNIQIYWIAETRTKGDYPRTKASDSKHLLALILNVFCENTRVMFIILLSTKVQIQ